MGKKKLFMKTVGGGSVPIVVPLTTNLVASYNFDTDLTDYTGNNNGTTPGTITHTAFKVNNGADFSGSVNDYVELPNTSDDFTFNDGAGSDIPFTISFWIDDLDASNTNDVYFWVGNDLNTRSVDIGRYGNNITARCYTNTNNRLEYNQFIGGAVVPVHYCMTYDGSKTANGLKVYVNGVEGSGTSSQVGTFTGINPTLQMQTLIGTIANFTSYEFEGKMDELHVWKDRKLTAVEVLDIYNTENAGNSILPLQIPLQNIISEYKFEDNVLDTVGVNNGTATAITYVSGVVGKSSRFIDSKIDFGTSTDFNFSNGTNDMPKSISFILENYDTANQYILGKNNNGWEWVISYFSGILTFTIYGDTTSDRIRLDYTFAFSSNTPRHFIFTCDGSGSQNGLKLFIDGSLISTVNSTLGTYTRGGVHSSNLIVGQSELVLSTYSLNGDLDCLRFWNKELTQAEITLLATDELAGIDINPQIPLQNIISQWKFEDNVLDTVGTNDGTPTALTYANGLVNRTGVFNGSANVSLTTLPIPTDEFSISFLAKTSGTSEGRIVGWSNWSGYTRIEFNSGGTLNRIGYVVNDGTGGASIVVDGYDLTDWIHIVVTAKANNSSKIYVNGVYGNGNLSLQGFVSIAGNNYIGSNRNGNASLFQGDIDCVRIWNKELSQVEITLIATEELAGTDINP